MLSTSVLEYELTISCRAFNSGSRPGMLRTWVFVGLFGIVFSMDPCRNNCRTSVEFPVVSSTKLKVLNVPWFSPVKLDIFTYVE